ncbi:pyridoxal phosphate-dependent aminotransferase [Simiduia agarivorans]|uniref:Aminotransferase n=1 Tax=Simiduia agarivorans (strain DSM 21679 / JCM 13881 / BCRC 17597 / SA1) TaxID=1117647 RepID=K4KJE5_SIMAS|nr:pyridoxal phosphate-dependent aminotransferase [Simiduia agarivorans]AFU98118.1 aspartate aminotransferase [Simiduia agarivorans SA1 = DSM 21679]
MSAKPLSVSAMAHRLDGEASEVWAVHDKALERKSAGDDIILLCVGDPDFPTPEPIFYQALAAMKRDRTHYSPAEGELGLREAIADLESKTSPHPCSADDVVVFPGATNALFSVFSCLCNPGDEVVVPDPMYVGYCGVFDAVGVKTVPVPLLAAQNFALDMDAMKAAITDKTVAVIVNTPGNPCGNMIPQEQLRELAAYTRERGVWLISDEVYSMITFKQRHRSLRASAESLDNVIMVDGLSKSHAMSGWRIGWVVAPPALVGHLTNMAGASIFGCPQFIQDAAAFALRYDDYYVAQMRDEYQKRRDFLVQRINAMPGVSADMPDAGMFVMMNTAKVATSGQAFAEQLLAQTGVSVVPGAGFGEVTEHYVRITLAQPIPVLTDAMDRLETMLSVTQAAAG